VILTAALVFGMLVAWVGIGFMGASPASVAIHSLLVLVPGLAIGWTLRKHNRNRGRTIEDPMI